MPLTRTVHSSVISKAVLVWLFRIPTSNTALEIRATLADDDGGDARNSVTRKVVGGLHGSRTLVLGF